MPEDLIGVFWPIRMDHTRFHKWLTKLIIRGSSIKLLYSAAPLPFWFARFFLADHKSLTNSDKLRCCSWYSLFLILDGRLYSVFIVSAAVPLTASMRSRDMIRVREWGRWSLFGGKQAENSKSGCAGSKRRTFACTWAWYTSTVAAVVMQVSTALSLYASRMRTRAGR